MMTIKQNAVKRVENAIIAGKMTRAEACEICNREQASYKSHTIVAHHWNGYDDPLNVWWLCRSCNRILAHKHDGSLNKDQAKAYVRQRQLVILGLA